MINIKKNYNQLLNKNLVINHLIRLKSKKSIKMMKAKMKTKKALNKKHSFKTIKIS